MKYLFNFENREKSPRFNPEKLILAALQDAEQLYYMMDTQYEGIYQAEAVERQRTYGNNALKRILESSSFRWMDDWKPRVVSAFLQLEKQKIAVFRRGLHFYSEIDYEDLVPGDVVFLSAGDVVPSDLRIIFSKTLEVDQSLYTGQSQPIRKTANFSSTTAGLEQLLNLSNICFTCSIVMGGLARGVVIGTGKATYLSHLLML